MGVHIEIFFLLSVEKWGKLGVKGPKILFSVGRLGEGGRQWANGPLSSQRKRHSLHHVENRGWIDEKTPKRNLPWQEMKFDTHQAAVMLQYNGILQ